MMRTFVRFVNVTFIYFKVLQKEMKSLKTH